MLIRQLPQESATKTALRNATPAHALRASGGDAPYGAWSQTDMLLAELIDVARWLQWSKTKAAEDGKDAPTPFPRPGIERPAEKSARVIHLLDYMRANEGRPPENYQPPT